MRTDFPESSFKKERVNHMRMQGKYIANSAVFIGKKAQVQMGKPVGATRYDFKFDFEKCKQIDYSVTFGDADKKLQGNYLS